MRSALADPHFRYCGFTADRSAVRSPHPHFRDNHSLTLFNSYFVWKINHIFIQWWFFNAQTAWFAWKWAANFFDYCPVNFNIVNPFSTSKLLLKSLYYKILECLKRAHIHVLPLYWIYISLDKNSKFAIPIFVSLCK